MATHTLTLFHKYVEVGGLNAYPGQRYGFFDGSYGDISNSSGGSTDTSCDRFHEGEDIVSIYHLNYLGGILYLEVSGNLSNSGWDRLIIGNTTFNFDDHDGRTYYSSSDTTQWRWQGTSSSPFGTTTNAIIPVKLQFDVTDDAGINVNGTNYVTRFSATDTTTTSRISLNNLNYSFRYRLVVIEGSTPDTSSSAADVLPVTGATRTASLQSTFVAAVSDCPSRGSRTKYKLQVGATFAPFDDYTASPNNVWVDCDPALSAGPAEVIWIREGNKSDIKFVKAGTTSSETGYNEIGNQGGLLGDISDTDEPSTPQTDKNLTIVPFGSTEVEKLSSGSNGDFLMKTDGTSGSAVNAEWEYLSIEDQGLLYRQDAAYTRSGSTADKAQWVWADADLPWTNTPFPNTTNYYRFVWGCNRFEQFAINSTTTQDFVVARLTKNNGTQIGSDLSDSGGLANLEFDITNNVSPGDVVTLTVYYVSNNNFSGSSTSTFRAAASESTVVTTGGHLTISGSFNQGSAEYTEFTVTATDLSNSTGIGGPSFVSTGEIFQRGYSFVVTSTLAFVNFEYNPNLQSSNKKKFLITVDNSLNAPVIDNVTTTADQFIETPQVFVNLTSPGTGPAGSLKYAQGTSSTTPPSTGWQTSNIFTQSRNTTRYYWASRDEDTAGSFDGPEPATGLALTYFATDSSIDTIQNRSFSNTATFFDVSISGGSRPTTYEIRSGSYTGTVLESIMGNGTLRINTVPADNSSALYYVTAYVKQSNGGNPNETRTNIQAFQVTTSAISDDYGLKVFNSSGTLVFDPEQISNIRVFESGTTTLSEDQTLTISGNGAGIGNPYRAGTYISLPESDDIDVVEIEYSSVADTVDITNKDPATTTYAYVVYKYK